MALMMRDAFALQIVPRLNKIFAHRTGKATTIFAFTNWMSVKHDQTIRTITMATAEVGNCPCLINRTTGKKCAKIYRRQYGILLCVKYVCELCV